MKDIYVLATASERPVSLDALREAFEAEDVQFTPGTEGLFFSVRAEETTIEVRFSSRDERLGWTPDLVTGSPQSREAMRQARGFYRIAFDPGQPQPSVPVFEALWCARSIMEHIEGVLLDVTSFKLHEPADVVEMTELDFDIRDHLSLHAVEATETSTPLWVHSHGMEKFGSRNVELFHLAEEDLRAAEIFVHELCTDLAFGHGPAPRSLIETSAGASFMLVPSDEGRQNLFGVEPETYEGHEGLFWTVVGPDGRHSVGALLEPYRERFEKETEEEAEAHLEQAKALLPAFKARFLRRGLMEPLTFLVRAPFESHPEGEPVVENLWAEVLSWEDQTLVGKLVEGGDHTTEWRKGTQVEITEEQVNALALTREGRALDEPEVEELLAAEKPM